MKQRPGTFVAARLSKIKRHPIFAVAGTILAFIFGLFIERHFIDGQPLDELRSLLNRAIWALPDSGPAHVMLALFALYLLCKGSNQAVIEEARLAAKHEERLTSEAAELAKPIAALLDRYDCRLVALQDYIVLQERQKVIEQIMAANEEQLWKIRDFTEKTVRIIPADEKSPMARDHINSLYQKIGEWHMSVQRVMTTQDWFSEEDKKSISSHANGPLIGGIDEAKNLEGDDRLHYANWIVRQRAVAKILTAKATETRQKMQEASNIFSSHMRP
ncbi:MAG: hypothetical protein IBJ07_11570 [Rhizobiaceae bacterium]|nr:hypothetical protein [Rhizobiaceae bacterium]